MRKLLLPCLALAFSTVALVVLYNGFAAAFNIDSPKAYHWGMVVYFFFWWAVVAALLRTARKPEVRKQEDKRQSVASLYAG